MKKRERKYLLIRKACINKKPCGEFPYFRARYPDATCIDGMLWDLDSSENDGMLYSGGDYPCPFCNTRAYIQQYIDSCWPVKQIADHVLFLRKKYQ